MGTKTLVIGLDGFGLSLIENYIAAGLLPNIARILNGKKRITVKNNPGFGDGAYWTSVATGASAAEHGNFYILQYDHKAYDYVWFDELTDMKHSSYWARLDQKGLSTFTVDWPHGPFEKLKNGVVIDNWLQIDAPHLARSFPPEAMDEILRKYGDDPFRPGLQAHPIETVEKARWIIDAAVKRIDTKAKACAERIAASDWDCCGVVFSEVHSVSHNAFHIIDQGHHLYNAEIAREVGDPIAPICEETDRAVGRLVEAAGEDCEIVVVAGLGLQELVTANHVFDEVVRRLDLGPPSEEPPMEKARTAYRSRIPYPIRKALSPIKRFLTGQKTVKSDMIGRRFFDVIHVDHAGCIQINLKGREPHGRIEPGEEFERLIETITQDLFDIRDVETGEPIVEDVIDVRNVYDGPIADSVPDLFVLWRRDRHFSRIASPKIGEMDVPDRDVRTGDHYMIGDCWIDEKRAGSLNETQDVYPQDLAGLISMIAEERSAAGKRLVEA